MRALNSLLANFDTFLGQEGGHYQTFTLLLLLLLFCFFLTSFPTLRSPHVLFLKLVIDHQHQSLVFPLPQPTNHWFCMRSDPTHMVGPSLARASPGKIGRILNINRFSARYHLANPDHVRISPKISGFSECADEWGGLLPIEAAMVILHQKLEPEPIHCSDCFWAENLAKAGSSFRRSYYWYQSFL